MLIISLHNDISFFESMHNMTTLHSYFKFLFCILLCITATTQSMEPEKENSLNKKALWEKVIDNVAQSYPMYWYEQNIARRIYSIWFPVSNWMVSKDCQELGKEAQNAVGIPEKLHKPIEEFFYDDSTNGTTCPAYADPFAIHVYEKKFKKYKHGVKRCILHHEAVHCKYHDHAMGDLIQLATTLTIGGCIYKLCSDLKFTPIMVIAIGCFTSIMTAKTVKSKYLNYCERRADIESYYATQCAQCVQEMVPCHKNVILENEGYLPANEIIFIAKDLQRQNKICLYHEKQS